MKCELCCDDDCLDLPSLTEIQCSKYCKGIHACIGHVILESMILLYLFYLDRHSKSH